MKEKKVCKVCGGKHHGRGYCRKHYYEAIRDGTIEVNPKKERGVCKVEGCNNKHKAKGYCSKHYAQIKKYGKIIDKEKNKYRICKVDGCQNKVYSKGYCKKHYQQISRNGRITDGEHSYKEFNNYRFLEDYVEIDLENKYGEVIAVTLIDLEDLDIVKNYRWCYSNGYCEGSHGRSTNIRLNRLVMNASDDYVVDHINGDTLDNRKSNLRICTQGENSRNNKLSKRNKSGYKGVIYREKYKSYMVYITINKKRLYLGHYKTLEEAIEVRRKAEEKYFGEFKRDEEYL